MFQVDGEQSTEAASGSVLWLHHKQRGLRGRVSTCVERPMVMLMSLGLIFRAVLPKVLCHSAFRK